MDTENSNKEENFDPQGQFIEDYIKFLSEEEVFDYEVFLKEYKENPEFLEFSELVKELNETEDKDKVKNKIKAFEYKMKYKNTKYKIPVCEEDDYKLFISNLENLIEAGISTELRDREIGIKALPFFDNFIKIRKVALIKMSLKIDKRLLDRWDKRGRQGLVLHDLNIHNDILRFLNQVEQFILRGTDTILEFAVNDIHDEYGFNYFFHNITSEKSITINEFREVHETVNDLVYQLRKYYYNPPFTLLSDSNTLKWARINFFPDKDGIVTFRDRVMELNDIDKWLDLSGNADNPNGDETNLVCIAEKKLYSDPIRIIEKEPLNIISVYDGIIIYWVGALEAEDNAISRL